LGERDLDRDLNLVLALLFKFRAVPSLLRLHHWWTLLPHHFLLFFGLDKSFELLTHFFVSLKSAEEKEGLSLIPNNFKVLKNISASLQ